MSISRNLYVSSLIGLCTFLTACGGAPSESEIKSAFESRLKTDTEQMEKMVGKNNALSQMGGLKVLNKIGCKEDGEKAYRCDIEIEVTQDGKTNKGPMSMRFVKGSDGWVIMK